MAYDPSAKKSGKLGKLSPLEECQRWEMSSKNKGIHLWECF